MVNPVTQKRKDAKKFLANGLFFICFLLLCTSLPAQKNQSVVVDKNGVMRWENSREEVKGFGINYTVPFAHAYRAAKKLGISLEKEIDKDVYHFARLGFDLYRVHVWDCEISDTVGNLLDNEHLKLFDYMLLRMKERGMKFVLTPIAYWPNGFPEPPEKTPGFATKYGKDNCLVNPEAIKAQENYLFQFLNHVNPYTKIAYKDDPDIIAFEISNEPHHEGKPEEVTTFINRMVSSMRKTGCSKPIFYNISHKVHLADAYFKSNIQGGTFQWYPTGLGARHELGGNLLVNVDDYPTPYDKDERFRKMAKFVYEFDAADVGRSYIYPAMARSFRKAGVQLATHFAYDPTYLASVNTEYGTHYMNLVYAPQKALSLKIASEVFHQLPMYKNYGSYPVNTSFDGFRVSYEEDLAEYISDKKFFYTNSTKSIPAAPQQLENIAGFGNSALIKYEGYGAYFLDHIEPGVWRLEVMPDAIWVDDPFKRTSPKKEVAVINWREWPISVDLSDLGENYLVRGLNNGNTFSTNADKKSFKVSPGTYLLIKSGATFSQKENSKWNNVVLNEFIAPPTTLKKIYVLHEPLKEISANSKMELEATVVSPEEPESVEVNVYGSGFRPEILKMEKNGGYMYSVVLPERLAREGFLRYQISVKEGDNCLTFPSGLEGKPMSWDFYDDTFYEVRVVQNTSSVFLFDAVTDANELARQWVRGSSLVPSDDPAKAQLLVNPEGLFTEDNENKNGATRYDYSFRYFFGKRTKGRGSDLSSMKNIVFRGKALNNKSCKLQLALITKDGNAYGGVITVETSMNDYRLSISELKKVKLVTLPRPYPTFLPYYFESQSNDALDLSSIESLQFSIGPGIPESELQSRHGVAIESVRLEK